MIITMPRVSIRKLFIYLLGAASCVLLVLNFHQVTLGGAQNNLHAWGLGPSGSGSGPGGTGPPVPPVGKDLTDFEAKKKKPKVISNEDNKDEEEDLSAHEIKYRLTTDSPKVIRRDLFGEPLDPDNKIIPSVEERPYYLKGLIRPSPAEIDPVTGDRKCRLLPEEAPGEDRITNQLMFYPPKGQYPDKPEDPSTPLKTILLWNGVSSWGVRPGRGSFIKAQCPIDACAISSSRTDASKADLVLFKDHFAMPTFKRPADQLWMIYMLECPLHTQTFKNPTNMFNWTATYRSDSTIVTPYERWTYYNENVKVKAQEKNFAEGKTRQVAWFVSNCGARNGRLQYAKELQKFISVDIYGSCGSKKCPRSQQKECFDKLDKDYKFYLAFENSNCKDYITEKFFVNGLGHDVIPIVMGARPQDYERVAPYKSFIHVDDFTGPEQLAKYLHKLDQDDELYNQYFQWKDTGEFINTRFFCRVCAMLHDPKLAEQAYMADINEWWRGQGTCINGSWNKYQAALDREKQKKEKVEEEKATSEKKPDQVP